MIRLIIPSEQVRIRGKKIAQWVVFGNLEVAMDELIHIHSQGPEFRADSREIAKVFGIEHESLVKLIENYESQLEQLGIFRFEIGKLLQGAGRPEKFCCLNFDHIAFLLTISSPTEATKDLRLKLIIAFQDARNKMRPIDIALLTLPALWRRTFPDDFYGALLKLYGDEYDASQNKPQWMGAWTIKFIYRPLYEPLPGELRQRRRLYAVEMGTSEWRKLHQFIEEHAKENLRKHIIKVTTLLESSTSRQDFYERFAAMFYRHTQLLLQGGPDVDDYEVDKRQFFDTLKKAVRPTGRPPRKTSEPSSDAD